MFCLVRRFAISLEPAIFLSLCTTASAPKARSHLHTHTVRVYSCKCESFVLTNINIGETISSLSRELIVHKTHTHSAHTPSIFFCLCAHIIIFSKAKYLNWHKQQQQQLQNSHIAWNDIKSTCCLSSSVSISFSHFSRISVLFLLFHSSTNSSAHLI